MKENIKESDNIIDKLNRKNIGFFFVALIISCTICSFYMVYDFNGQGDFLNWLSFTLFSGTGTHMLLFTIIIGLWEAIFYLPFVLLFYFPISWVIWNSRYISAFVIFLFFTAILLSTYSYAETRWDNNYSTELSQWIRVFYTTGWVGLLAGMLHPLIYQIYENHLKSADNAKN